jgi:hypothetical protein
MLLPRPSQILAATLLISCVVATSARAYQVMQTFEQAASQTPVVWAATISVISCSGEGEKPGQYYIYAYKPPHVGFRAILPPNWSHAMGGRDFETFVQAATAACQPHRMPTAEPPSGPTQPKR